MKQHSSTLRRRNALLLLGALFLHAGLTTALYLIGAHQMVPAAVDPYGIGLTWAIDGVGHRASAELLARILSEEGFGAWLSAAAGPHVRVYSLCFALLARWCGPNILAVEPVNLGCYLLTIVLVYGIGKQAFSARTGLYAACVVALWPSYLLHTTQLLRDPLFIATLLTLVWAGVSWITREHSRAGWVGIALLGACAVFVLYLLRREAREVVLAITLLSAAWAAAAHLRGKRPRCWSAAGPLPAAATAVAMLIIPADSFRGPLPDPPGGPARLFRRAGESTDALSRIGRRRAEFALGYQDMGSNIDPDVRLTSIRDVAGYAPRAIAIGLFAPFPESWIEPGRQVGHPGRLLAGFETLCMYALTILALFGFARRRGAAAWLLLAVVITGALALGLVVANAGALFRLRYAFWMLLVVLGANGLESVRARPPRGGISGQPG